MNLTLQTNSSSVLRLICFVSTALFLVLTQACKKSDPKSNLAGISSFSIKGHETTTFTVDQNALKISNTDSLPYLTNVSALIANFESVGGSQVKVNGTVQVSGVTPNNFQNPIIYETVAEDGTVRSYTVKVNVAQIDPKSVSWKQQTANGGWGPYRTMTAGYFSNKFWVVGTNATTKGVHSSADGITWTTVAATDNNTNVVPFAERQTAVFGFKDKMWLLGGLVPSIGFNFSYVTNAVWSSANGTTWTATANVAAPANNEIWTPRERLNAVVYKDKLWVIGGNAYPAFGNINSTGTPQNDVWSTTDGTAWTRVAANAQFVARSNPAVLVHNNKMYVIGGKNGSNTLLNDIWVSEDGVTWTEMTVTAPFTARWGHKAVSFNNQLFIAGGRVADGVSKELWVSEDNGATWKKVETGDPRALPGTFEPRVHFGMFVNTGAVWIIGGEMQLDGTYSYRNDTWKGSLLK
ncbi:DUF6242 domain-containing protein [Pedobacter deserti]|uniref:DUF6242 domain-containing protein n=1 Tax=Pedobacter deserti TaxID=2817382 RepID=UPI00210E2F40|nr:DUF6242 domain-containing protein [Pedobacter sp. SYSU D00382]